MRRRYAPIIIFVAVLIVAVLASAGFLWLGKTKNKEKDKKAEVNALTFYNWWVSPGESAALSALVGVFTKKYPDTAVLPSSVVGGAGYSFLKIIKPLVTSGNPPDSFQMHAGYEGMPYYNAGLLDPVDDIWKSENLGQVIPSVVQDMTRFDGHYYSIPLDIHRANIIWYNKKLLLKYGIDPNSLTTWKDFFAACGKLRAQGVKYPIQIGETWTVAQVFEQINAGEGIDFYQDWINGKTVDPADPRLVSAIDTLKEYLSFVNPDNASLTWNDVVKRIIDGQSAFNLMGDWANGEFAVAKKVYGVDYGWIPAPGTKDAYGLVIDNFQRPKNIQHPTNADRWLETVASKEGQDTFNPLKGSIPARIDADISKYNAYQQSAIADFWKAKYMFPSVVHGSGAPESFKIMLGNLVADFVTDKDVGKMASRMTTYIQQIGDQYSIKWSLK